MQDDYACKYLISFVSSSSCSLDPSDQTPEESKVVTPNCTRVIIFSSDVESDCREFMSLFFSQEAQIACVLPISTFYRVTPNTLHALKGLRKQCQGHSEPPCTTRPARQMARQKGTITSQRADKLGAQKLAKLRLCNFCLGNFFFECRPRPVFGAFAARSTPSTSGWPSLHLHHHRRRRHHRRDFDEVSEEGGRGRSVVVVVDLRGEERGNAIAWMFVIVSMRTRRIQRRPPTPFHLEGSLSTLSV